MPCQFCPHCQELAKTKKNPDYLNVQELYDFGTEKGFTTVKQNLNRFAISRLLKKYDKEKIKEFVEYSKLSKSLSYAPQVYNFMDLEEKLGRLIDFATRNGKRFGQPESEDTTPRIIGFIKLKDGSMQPQYNIISTPKPNETKSNKL